MRKKVAVIGLDGMAWHILDRLFRCEVMPNLQAITEKSVKGTLPSTIPPESGPAWTSIATGVNPGKHGIFGFTRPTKSYDSIEIMSSSDVKYLRIHEMVAIQGLRSVCVNQLLTYPIKDIQGSSVVTDWLSPEIQYSAEIATYARNFRGPTLGKPFPLLNKDWDAEYADVSSRVDTVNALLQKVNWDLFWVVYSEPDHLFHRYYDLVMKEDKRLLQLLAKIDETFGIVKDLADLVMIPSDHGFRKYHYGAYVNGFLEKHGLIETVSRQTIQDISCQRQIDRPRMQFNLPRNLYGLFSGLPSQIELALSKIYRHLLKANIRARITTHVDPKTSKAFAHGFGVYVKKKELVELALSVLRKAHFIDSVWKREELYKGKCLEDMPDLIVVPAFGKGFAFRGDVVAPKSVVRRDFSAHHPNGILIIYNDDVLPSWIRGISVYDIVPTILDFLDLEIPKTTDGKVIDLHTRS
ncbi:hypothetical protein GTO27_04580 [Candidatus Bathyarchaeota archaeon]|nr:hypothetical protein [Candidatus Bathyarchaeota archaeon]